MNVDWFFTTQGRVTRIVVGSLLIIIGLGIIGGIFGVILLLVGAVPIASAAYGTFLLAPFFGRDIRGNKEGGAPTEDAPRGGSAREEDEDDDAETEDAESDDSTRDDAGGDSPRDDDADSRRDDGDDDDSRRDDDDADRSAASSDDKPAGARPVRAERPPGQGPRTKDLRAEGSGSSESDGG